MKTPYTMCGKRGDTIFQRNRYGQISYPYQSHIPSNPRSSAQRFVRGNFASVSKRWRTITEAQRLQWCSAAKTQLSRCRLGQRFPLRGFYYFVRVNVALANRGLPQVDLPPAERAESKPAGPLLSQILVQYDRGLINDVPPALRPFRRPWTVWSR